MGIIRSSKAHVDLSTETLLQKAQERQEGVLSASGAFAVTTGKRTGRSPKDRFIVKDALTEKTIDWGEINQAVTREVFDALWARTVQYLTDKEIFISHLQVGADPQESLLVEVITETAWHNLFAQNLFIRLGESFAEDEPHWTILSAPTLPTDPQVDGVNSDAALMIHFTERKVDKLTMINSNQILMKRN